MELVKKSEEYKVYKKRSGRFGVLDSKKKWIGGDSKVEILAKEGLIKLAPKKKAPEPEPEAKAEEGGEEVKDESAEK